MKAPDKIFIPKNIGIVPLVMLATECPDSIVYIRKDALLDWLNQRKKLMEEEIGFELSIDDVIDKLNSM